MFWKIKKQKINNKNMHDPETFSYRWDFVYADGAILSRGR